MTEITPQEAAPEEVETERFKNRKQAHTWLIQEGFKISQGKFYQDSWSGYFKVYRDGSVNLRQVLEYAKRLEVEKVAAATDGHFPEISFGARRTKAERMRMKQDLQRLRAATAGETVAALVGTLRDTISHHLYTGQRTIVEIAGGNQNRSQETFEAMDSLIDAAFNEVANKKEITVMFEADSVSTDIDGHSESSIIETIEP